MKIFEKLLNHLPRLHQLIFFVLTFYLNFQLFNLHLLRESQEAGFTLSIILGFIQLFLIILALSFYLAQHLSGRFLRNLGFGYFVYLLLSYMMTLSQNINSGAFKPGHLIDNGFLQVKALPVLAILLLTSFGIKFFVERTLISNDFIRDFRKNSRWEIGSFHLLMGTIIINDSAYRDYIGKPLLSTLAVGDMTTYHLNLILNLTWSLPLFCLVSYIFGQAWQSLRFQQRNFSLALVTSFLVAILTSYYLQLGVRKTELLLGQSIAAGAISFQVLVLFLLATLVYLLVNRYLAATFLIIGVGVVGAMANMIKEKMRSEPLLITDLVWLRQLKLVVNFVSPQAFWLLILSVGLALIFYYICRRLWFSPALLSFKQRCLLIGLVCLSLVTIVTINDEVVKKARLNLPSLSRLDKTMDIDWLGFSTNARYKSMMYVWVKQATQSIMQKPEDYSAESIQKIVEKYKEQAAIINQTRDTSISEQTVIYVLSESLANPNRLDGISLSQDILPNLEEVQLTTTSGLMLADSYGGGTANTEFQVLTGLPSFNYSSSVSVLYTEVVPKMKTFPAISDQFSMANRFVLHPASINNYSRNYIYSRLGFDKQIFSEASKDKFSRLERLGASASDQTVYDEVLRRIDPSENQFFSVITMQNHAPWSVGQPQEVTAQGKDFSPSANNNLTEYARLLTHSDQALNNFLTQLSRLDKAVTVVFYGDHLPGFYPESTFAKNPKSKYQTDYFIWSNYQDKKLNYPLVRSSDLTAELLEHTNARVSPYYALLTRVFESEQLTEKMETDSEIATPSKELKLLQYDMTLGKNYISRYSDFFEEMK